jgi:hypothetical protein
VLRLTALAPEIRLVIVPLPLTTILITHQEINLLLNQGTNLLRVVTTMEALGSIVLTAWMSAMEQDRDTRLITMATNTDTAVLSPRMHLRGGRPRPEALIHLHTMEGILLASMVTMAVAWEGNIIKVA